MNQIGILGLSPKGSFGNYLRKTYQEDVNVLINYQSFQKMDDGQIDFDSNVILQPEIDEKVTTIESEVVGEDSWTFKASIQLDNAIEPSLKDVDVCLTS